MSSLPLRSTSWILVSFALVACGDSAGPGGSAQGGENAGGNNTGAAQQGGSGGNDAGGAQQGGAGGDNAGGAAEQGGAGGDSTGGAGGGAEATLQDCIDAQIAFLAAYEACGVKTGGSTDCSEIKPENYDGMVCAAACAENASCPAITGRDTDGQLALAQCISDCV